MSKARVWAVVPAAGVGSRFGGGLPKQYALIDGVTIAQRSLSTLLSTRVFSEVIVAVAAKDHHFATLPVADEAALTAVEGGASRAESVLRGLQALVEKAHIDDWVMVHDIARPLLSKNKITELLAQLENHTSGGILAIPSSDTVKRSDAEQAVVETIDRATIWLAQTPQMFRFGKLIAAVEQAIDDGVAITDEASAMEFAGHSVQLVRGEKQNIKITEREDLPLAEYYLANSVEN